MDKRTSLALHKNTSYSLFLLFIRPLEDKEFKYVVSILSCVYLNIYIVYACGCAQGACVYGLNVYDVHAWV